MKIEEPAIAFIHCERCGQIYDHQWLQTPPRNKPWEIHDGFCGRCGDDTDIYTAETILPSTLIMRR